MLSSLKVWVLDATPGKVRPGGDGEDHPGELISFLSGMPQKVRFFPVNWFYLSSIMENTYCSFCII